MIGCHNSVRRAEGCIRTPNDIRISGSRVCKLWSETCPAVGTTTPATPTLPALGSWSSTVGFTKSGTGPVTLMGSGLNENHYYLQIPVTGLVTTKLHCEAIIKAEGAQRWVLIYAGNVRAVFDLISGVVGTAEFGSPTNKAITALAGGYFLCAFDGVGTNVGIDVVPQPSDSFGISAWTMPATDGVTVSSFGVTQIRASAQNNLARADDGSLIDATGGVQTTIANQPLILDQNGNFYTGSSGQVPVVTKEAGRAAYLVYTDPDVVGIASGDDPAFWMMGIGSFTSDLNGPFYFEGSGTIRHSLVNYGGRIYATRNDGITQSEIDVGAASAWASLACWSFRVSSARVATLRVQGVDVGSDTFADLASADMTLLRTNRAATTVGTNRCLALVGGTGDVTAAQLLPVAQALCSRYPGLGLVA